MFLSISPISFILRAVRSSKYCISISILQTPNPSSKPISVQLTDIYLSTICIPLLNFATSIYAGLALFAFIGHISKQTGVPIEDMPIKGMELCFVVYPYLLNTLPWPQLWSVMFFLMLTFAGLSSEYMFIETASGMVYGMLNRSKSFKRSQTFVTAILYAIALIINLVFFASGAGYYWLEAVDHYATGINLVVFLFVQLIALVYLLPVSDLEKKVNAYGEHFPKLYHICLKFVCPAFALFLSLTAIINEFKREHNYNNIFELLICWLIFLTPITLFLIFFFYNPFSETSKENNSKYDRLDKILEE